MATGLENLKVYGMAEDLEISVHKITKDFPSDEKFRSVDQLRRSSASVANNIAEGYNRYSYQEKIRYLIIAKAEAEETKRNILKSAKKEFVAENLAEEMANKYTELIKAISGYIRFIKENKAKNSRT
ncbi:MAG: four helix bundle protein [Patescibacteria group bacterium]|jgi:four helix bundle protein